MKTKSKTKKRPKSKRLPLAAPTGSARPVEISHRCFIDALGRAIEFHRNNPNDPHNVGTAVMVALTEVRDAFKAYMV